ncbi:S1 family peptidase [Cystobacter fuscus]|uniref:S1 family peptidase n=1 Tax=Cystobacter fuscus TaxID=43 RepID=UPI0037BEB68E
MTNGESSDVLRETVLPVRDNETCNAVGIEPFLGDTKVCAGFVDGATGVCHGDSGGPLVVRSPRYGGGWEQIGIVSHGIALGGSCQGYGVFTRVSRYVSWIQGYTQPVSALDSH